MSSGTARRVVPGQGENPNMVDDERLLIERKKKDPSAVAILYRRHYEAIASYIHRRVPNSSDADDLVAEAFLTMVRYLPRYRPRGTPFRAWLYRLATTQVNRWIRRQLRSVGRRLYEEAQQFIASIPGDIECPIEADLVRLAPMSLPPRWQSVLSLHYMEGMSVKEIAKVLGCAVGTMKSHLSRGREAMRHRLVRKGGYHK